MKRGVIRSIKDKIFFNSKYRTLLLGDHFGVRVRKNGDQFGVGIISGSIWASFRGWGSFRGRVHFGGCTDPENEVGLSSNPFLLFSSRVDNLADELSLLESPKTKQSYQSPLLCK